ncbi:hypothetical protein JRO89_XS13G0172500 [Xanthoceras sorbifolium]|uniref:Uncharacterized protein n=1 Tax=Xanthoceras sorbifolium TaxID=99658 RepID=A0ABQ8H8T3_9ROSI|nr:hypothetical protein JRO89_XS13G0172500 [Xanthoceras sorbifolium]
MVLNPTSLFARVLKGCYFPSSNFLDAQAHASSSFVWKIFVWGRDLIERGSSPGECAQVAVRWVGCEVVEEAFLPVDRQAILSIPSTSYRMLDVLCWHYDPSSDFTVKSGYRFCKSIEMVAGSSRGSSNSP